MKKRFFLSAFISVVFAVGGLSFGWSKTQIKKKPAQIIKGIHTYTVVRDFTFVYENPAAPLWGENITGEELENYSGDLAPYFVYGSNLSGEIEPDKPGFVKINYKLDKQEKTGYVRIKGLWLEPALKQSEAGKYQCVKNSAAVYLLPDTKSKAVFNLLMGEVIATAGGLKHKEKDWIKAEFNSAKGLRYGYLRSADVKPLIAGQIDPMKLEIAEIPQTIRGSGISFSPAERTKLARSGFYIENTSPLPFLAVDDLVDLYNRNWDGQFFISADLFLHCFYLIFDRMFQNIEEEKFFPLIQQIVKNLAQQTNEEFKFYRPYPPEVREALLYNLFFLSVAAKLFDPEFAPPGRIRGEVEDTVNKVINCSGTAFPVSDKIKPEDEDFSSYRIRGYYANSQALQRYFRGMIWLERRSFLLSDKAKTLSAILLARAANKSEELDSLKEISSLRSYLSGRTEDYTIWDYLKVCKEIYGAETPDISHLAKNWDNNFKLFQVIFRKTLPKRIVSSEGFKLFGRRFSWDSYIFSQLTSPGVGSPENYRVLPSALDVMMALGSGAAKKNQEELQAKYQWENYPAQAAKISREISAILDKKETFPEQWLSALKTLFRSPSGKQLFCHDESWAYKNLNSALSSWTEFKDDTVLVHSKIAQIVPEPVDNSKESKIPPYNAPYPKGYVEPNPAFFAQLYRLAEKKYLELNKTGFISEEYVNKFTVFAHLIRKAEEIARKEVEGKPIIHEDYQWIKEMSFSLNKELLLPGENRKFIDPGSLRMALINDAAVDVYQWGVLEEAIGLPQRIIVMVKDVYGGTRAVVGYVYSWCEFPSSKRWNDQEWRRKIYTSDPAKRAELKKLQPAWYEKFRP
ncbi:MAG: DUF3160 domain-containing protein [Elusimicrobiota bacterium]